MRDLICTAAATLAASPLRSPREAAPLVARFEAECFGRCSAKIGPCGHRDADWRAVRSCAEWALAIGRAANRDALCACWPAARLARARPTRARGGGHFLGGMAARLGCDDLAPCERGIL